MLMLLFTILFQPHNRRTDNFDFVSCQCTCHCRHWDSCHCCVVVANSVWWCFLFLFLWYRPFFFGRCCCCCYFTLIFCEWCYYVLLKTFWSTFLLISTQNQKIVVVVQIYPRHLIWRQHIFLSLIISVVVILITLYYHHRLLSSILFSVGLACCYCQTIIPHKSTNVID